MHEIWNALFEPGFFASPQVHVALAVGAVVATVSAIVGVFTVLRGQSFGGHALGDVSAAGGAGALLIGLAPIVGFIGFGLVGAAAMDAIGVRRLRGRDLATGVVLGAAIGLSALFLYLITTTGTTTGAAQQVLFGSIYTTTGGTLTMVAVMGAVALAGIALVARPLLLATVGPDIAAVAGVRVRLVGLSFMVTLAMAVALSSIAVGAILSTALLIGPAAAALRIANRLATAVILASLTGVAATWLGVLLAYDSYHWGTSRQPLPVSFFIVTLVFAAYLASGLRGRPRAKTRDVADGPKESACSPAS